MTKESNSATRSILVQEILGLLVLACSVILALSLATFTWGNASTNWIGLLGFAIGGALLYLFGLGSYLIVLFIGWIGWRFLVRRPIEHLAVRAALFAALLVSSCLLFTIIADNSPKVSALLSALVPSSPAKIADLSYVQQRTYLGGIPLYYLYRDLPFVGVHQLLGVVGTSLVCFSISSICFLLITQMRLVPLVTRIAKTLGSLFAGVGRGCAKLIKLLKRREKPQVVKVVDPAQGAKPPPLELLAPSLSEPRLAAPAEERRALRQPDSRKLKGPLYELPAFSLLSSPPKVDRSTLKRDLANQAKVLEETLASFGIEAKVGQIHCGPTIASFEVHPSTGVKVQKIKTLESDLALNLQARSIRIIAPIPGKAAVGIEVPTPCKQEVNFREMLSAYRGSSSRFALPLLLGQAVNGADVSCDLTRLPHCIIAGATGSGKSVCVNAMIISLLMNCRPADLRLLLIDPKKVELTPYSRLPHQLAPVITEPSEAALALKWLVGEMLRRYELLKQLGFRNITSFNMRSIDNEAEEALEIDVPERLSYIVCVIDELADLMMAGSSSDIETSITRIAQMARAVGIHMIVATQRPSREVITGLIKANFPARLAFKVASSINSRIILDDTGAEALLGDGDMLFLPPGSPGPIRAQGVFVRDADISRVIKHACRQGPTNYLIESFQNHARSAAGLDGERDDLYNQAHEIVTQSGMASTTYLQRKLKIGYARAASIMDQLEEDGIIGPQEGSRARRVLSKKK